MVGSSAMKLVFRLHGVGFALPLDDLVEVGEGLPARVERLVGGPVAGVLGYVLHRDIEVPLYDLAYSLDLGATELASANLFLVLKGADRPWALAIDLVAGIFPVADFICVPVPEWYFQSHNRPFHSLAIWHTEPLILCEALPFEQTWGGL